MAKKTTKKTNPIISTIPIVADKPKINYQHFYQCTLELMEDTMFVSSEYGNEYHCHGLIGNTALPYSLGFAPSPYKKFKLPMHTVHLKQLAAKGVYITPATPINTVDFKMDRFNSRPDQYNLTWGNAKGRKENYPDEGWFKSLHRGNQFLFYVLSESPLKFPQYIRLGKFMSKAKVSVHEIEAKDHPEVSDEINMEGYLRAEDIPASILITQYEKTPMQHSTYLSKVVMKGVFYQLPSTTSIPFYVPKGIAFYAA